VTELVDCGLDGDALSAIKHTAAAVEGVLAVRTMRGRRMGPFIAVELCADVNPYISISVAHHVRCQIISTIRHHHEEVHPPSLTALGALNKAETSPAGDALCRSPEPPRRAGGGRVGDGGADGCCAAPGGTLPGGGRGGRAPRGERPGMPWRDTCRTDCILHHVSPRHTIPPTPLTGGACLICRACVCVCWCVCVCVNGSSPVTCGS
jgi:hypothetical protein